MSTVKAIVIQQPWPWAIFHAPLRKSVENRVWPSGYLGPLVIVAGKSKKSLSDAEWLRNQGQGLCNEKLLPRGCAVGIVNMVGCERPMDLPFTRDYQMYAFGPWCHVYRDAVAFETPVPVSGFQRIFSLQLTGELARQIEIAKQLQQEAVSA